MANITSSLLSNSFIFQAINNIEKKAGTHENRSFKDTTANPKYKSVLEKILCQYSNGVLKIVKDTAGFAIQQIMESSELHTLAPALKPNLLTLITLFNQLQSAEARECIPDEFRCNDGLCLFKLAQCDGEDDCNDGSDEMGCDQDKCNTLENRPNHCDESTCFINKKLCNGNYDCNDKSDEEGCDQDKCDALDRPHLCEGESKCLHQGNLCNGAQDCINNSDEEGCDKNKCNELDRPHHCDNSTCILENWICDGSNECADGSDELPEICFPETITTSNATSTSTKYSTTTTNSNDDTAPPSMAWIAAPIIGFTLLTIGIVYACCAYKSYSTIRQKHPQLTKTQARNEALQHPFYFHTPVAIAQAIEADSI